MLKPATELQRAMYEIKGISYIGKDYSLVNGNLGGTQTTAYLVSVSKREETKLVSMISMQETAI